MNGNITAGPGCVLSGTTVSGNVSVDPGGSLEASNSTISGNVKSQGAASVVVLDSVVGGNVQILGTTAGGLSVVQGGTVKGNVEFKNSAAYGGVAFVTVGGNLQVQNDSGSDSSGQLGEILVVSNVVAGNIEVANNSPTGTILSYLTVEDNSQSAGGNLLMHDNQATGGALYDEMFAYQNAVAGNLEFHDNVATGPAGASIYLDVSLNTVNNNLNCHNDTPAATDDFGANTANRKIGECASL